MKLLPLSSSRVWFQGFQFRPNKKISVFQVTGLKILGRLGAHILLIKKI